eukprot:TRINITY_DN14943_c0_g1_i1.p1 TRINITY_DN14943_c0_g1~~TRINITY_DN14943_c0_g1_i1.p1  ORF type:complete len:405 (+),score=74.96 TRINITY_DN14943_c0_g1_i1:124-1338(+)
MKCVLILLSLLAFHGAASSASTFKPPVFTLDLDVSPEDRWTHIVQHYGDQFPSVVRYFSSKLPKEVIPLIEDIAASVDPLLGDLGREMRGIAKTSGLDLGLIVTLNFLYELRDLGPGHPNTTGGRLPPLSDSLAASRLRALSDRRASGLPRPDYTNGRRPGACTSIVASSAADVSADGAIAWDSPIHARNLDWDLPDSIRNMTFECRWMRGGRELTRGICIAGYVGILSGMAPGKFSVTINERLIGGNLAIDALAAILAGGEAVTHASRRILFAAADYATSVDALASAHLAAPVYYIVAGVNPGDGVVLTRDRLGVHSRREATLPSSWYVLQTNYDWDTEPPAQDNRRAWAVYYMEGVGARNWTTTSAMRVLGSWPVGNEFTTYSVVMLPKHSTLDVLVRLTGR